MTAAKLNALNRRNAILFDLLHHPTRYWIDIAADHKVSRSLVAAVARKAGIKRERKRKKALAAEAGG